MPGFIGSMYGKHYFRVTEDASLQTVDIDISHLDFADPNDYDVVCTVGDIYVYNKQAGTISIGFSSDSNLLGYGEIMVVPRRAIHGRDNIT